MENQTSKPKKIIVEISKQEIFKRLKVSNETDARKELSEIAIAYRKQLPKYADYTDERIKRDNKVLIAELKIYLRNNDLDENLFD